MTGKRETNKWETLSCTKHNVPYSYQEWNFKNHLRTVWNQKRFWMSGLSLGHGTAQKNIFLLQRSLHLLCMLIQSQNPEMPHFEEWFLFKKNQTMFWSWGESQRIIWRLVLGTSAIYRQSSVRTNHKKIFPVIIPSIFLPFTYVTHLNIG